MAGMATHLCTSSTITNMSAAACTAPADGLTLLLRRAMHELPNPYFFSVEKGGAQLGYRLNCRHV